MNEALRSPFRPTPGRSELQHHIKRKAFRLQCMIEAEDDPEYKGEFPCTKQAIREHRRELNVMKSRLAAMQKKKEQPEKEETL